MKRKFRTRGVLRSHCLVWMALVLGPILCPAPLQAGQNGAAGSKTPWTLTGSLRQARFGFQATTLLDGRVLAEGGNSPTGLVKRSELFDPVGKVWSDGGPMIIPRQNHKATLLEDGRVLVEGGYGAAHGRTAALQAEVYDPAQGRWRLTAPMHVERPIGFDAVRLQDGRVLVAGGTGNGPILSSAEIYDPAGGTWSLTGDMGIKVYYFTLTLLSDGRVLLVGGVDSHSTTSATVLLYEPANGTWMPTGSLHTSRSGHSATLLENGQVLVAGGGTGTGSAIGSIDSGELYDPVTGTWTLTGNLKAARGSHTATRLLDGSVEVTGGTFAIPNGNITYLQSTELYNPATGQWQMNGALNLPTAGHQAAPLHDGEVLVAGGLFKNGPVSDTLAVSQVGPP